MNDSKRQQITEEELMKLVEQMKQGNEGAFTKFYEHTHTHLSFYLSQYTKNDEEIKDVLQETYLQVHKSIDTLRNEKAVMGWLRTTARHKWIDGVRKERFTFVPYEGNEEVLDTEEQHTDLLPEVKANADECNRLLRDIIGNLNEAQRMVIVEFYYNNRTMKEISEELQVPEGTVKSTASRTKGVIKEKVLELDKKYGTRIYSTSLAPLLFQFFQHAESEFVLPSALQGLEAVMTNAMISGTATGTSSSAIGGLVLKFGGLAMKTKVIVCVVASIIVVAGTGGTIYAVAEHKQQVAEQQAIEEAEALQKKYSTPEIVLVSKEIKAIKGKSINAGELIASITSSETLKEVKFSVGAIKDGNTAFDKNGVPDAQLKFDEVGEKIVTITVTNEVGKHATATILIDVIEELEASVKGISDKIIEEGAENVDFMKDITFDKNVVKEVTVDAKSVDTKKIGTYDITYTIVPVKEGKEVLAKVKVEVISKEDAQKKADKGERVVTNGGEVKKDSKGKAPEVKGDNSVVADGSRGESGKPTTGGTGGSVASKPESKPDSSKPESKPVPKPDTSKPDTSKPDTSKPETTKPDQHVHSWSPVTAYRKVLVSDAWSEPIYEMQDVWGTEPVYEYRVICSICGNDISSNQVDHMIGHIAEGKTQGEGILESTQVGTRPVVIGQSKVQVGQTDHPAVYADEAYVSHYACSCGATK